MEKGKRIKLSHKIITYSAILIVALFLGYVTIQPLLADVHNQRAQREYDSMEWDRAIVEYEKAISIQPSNAEYHLQLARIYSRLAYLYQDKKVLKKAIAEFGIALKLNPYNGLAYSQFGWTYKQHGMYREAVEELKQAVELDPTNISFHWRLGTVYRVNKELNKAKEEFEKILNVAPERQEAKLALAQINEELKTNTQ